MPPSERTSERPSETSSRPDARSAAQALARSGWVPAFLVLVIAVGLLREAAQVGIGDQVRFAVYLAGWVTFPGTVVWRLVDRRAGDRPLVQDLALGTLVGYVIEFPVYLALLGLGHPRWYLLWPVLVLGLCLGTPRGRSLLWRRGPRMSTGWSWSVAAGLGYALFWFAHNVWGPAPSQGPTLRTPYVDEPYHLALIGSLKHFSPPKVTFVQDTPLDYHYLSHVHMAASSWASGIEPIVLLRSLSLPVVAIVVLLALAVAASRLSGRTWLGPVALLGLLVVPANFSGGSDGAAAGFLAIHLEISPSAGFVNAAMLLGVLLVIELLRGEQSGPLAWVLTMLTMIAMTGGKATSLPALTAALLLTTIVASIAARGIAKRPLALLVLGGVSFLIARLLFFGKNAQGLELEPLGIYGRVTKTYPALANADGDLEFATRLVIAVSVLSALTLAAGVLVGLLRGGWRDSGMVFLVGVCGAGYGMALSLHQIGYSEGYFIIAVQISLILGAALGISRHAAHLSALGSGLAGRGAGRLRDGGVRLAVLAVGSGLAAGWLYTQANQPMGRKVEGSPVWVAFRIYAIPALTVVLGAAAVAAVLLVVLRRRGNAASAPGGSVLVPGAIIAALVLAGIGMAPTTYRLERMASDPIQAPPANATTLIGSGGIKAARYLREHADLDAVVATNAHCQFPPKRRPVCVPRHFWMAGFAERQFLVEGWAYVSRASVGLDAPAGENITTAPFWDPRRLEDNDLALLEPTAETVGVLRDEYDVSWVLIDRAYPADLAGLRQFADPVYRNERYTVLKLK